MTTMATNTKVAATFGGIIYLALKLSVTAFVFPPQGGVDSSSSFVSGAKNLKHGSSSSSSSLQMADVSLLNQLASLAPEQIAAAAGLAGSAVGWSTRSAEVSTLQKENVKTTKALDETIKELDETKQEYDDKMEKYETTIFEMDKEFEGQTDKIRLEFEARLDTAEKGYKKKYKTKLDKARRELENESELKLIKQGGKLRQEFLEERLAYENEFSNKSQKEVMQALGAQSKLVSENNELKDSLDQIKRDLEEINRMTGRM